MERSGVSLKAPQVTRIGAKCLSACGRAIGADFRPAGGGWVRTDLGGANSARRPRRAGPARAPVLALAAGEPTVCVPLLASV